MSLHRETDQLNTHIPIASMSFVHRMEGTMSQTDHMDPEKLQIILASLEKRFYKILSFGGDFSTLFIFNNDRQNWQLKFNRAFLENIHPNVQLQLFLDRQVFPAILENPNRRIEIGSDGGITIAEKQS